MKKFNLLIIILCVFSAINAQVNINGRAKESFESQNCKFTKVNKAKAEQEKTALYLQDFEGDFPGKMIIMDIDGLTSSNSANIPGKWGIIIRRDDITNHCGAVTSFYDNGNKTSNDWMITPKITIPENGDIYLIWEASSWSKSYLDTYEVLVSETEPDPDNFDETIFEKIFDNTEPNVFDYHSLDLVSYSGKEVWIAFRNISEYKYAILIDNIQVDDYSGLDLELNSLLYQEKVTINQAQNIEGLVTNLRATIVTGFDVNWKVDNGPTNTYSVNNIDLGLMDTYEFEHIIPYKPGTLATETVTVWISNVNGITDDSADNNQMTMDVEAIEGSYYQDFQGGLSGIYTYDLDKLPFGKFGLQAWEFLKNGEDAYAYSFCVEETNDWMVFPKITIGKDETLMWKWNTLKGWNHKYEIYLGDIFDPENFDTSSFTLIETVEGVGPEEWETLMLSLSEYEGQEKYLAFRNVSTNGGDLLNIDDIYIYTPTTEIDGELVRVKNIQDFYGVNEEIKVEGIFMNNSISEVTSYEISYQYGDAPVISQTFDAATISYLMEDEFSFDQKITTDAQGEYTFKIWISKVNNEEDKNTDNNEITINIEAVSDPQPKTVLIEEFTGTWCGYCPIGGLTMNDLINEYDGKVIGFAHHDKDQMTITNASSILDAYAWAFPTATINRSFWEDQNNYGITIDTWNNKVNKSLAIPTSINVEVSNEYNSETREISAELTVNFTTNKSGNFAMHLYIVEDSVSGEGYGWDQVNYYNDDSNSPYYQAGNPIVGFQHRHVVRNILSNTWGDTDIIPNENASGEYSKTYLFTLPEEYKIKDISIIGFVSKYDENNKANRSILNTAETHINLNTGIEYNENALDISIYPNPTAGNININKLDNADIYVYNVIGELINTKSKQKGSVIIDLSSFGKGIYLVKVIEGTKTNISKILVR